ncbi:hypothetical protein HPB50_008330 [Hyalomma asiaticum]|uniref:Uncharacterized protein n=1 Tax=Hyalomma asiaticum TaxID=266040 RepID=A0ACB7SWU1_HYAAI|nr:hypothetical protein HPB50_008330 [Hyalomma asiaticum]
MSTAPKPEAVSENASSPTQQPSDTQQQVRREETSAGEHRHAAAAHDGSKSPRLTGDAATSGRKSPTSEVHRPKRTPSSPSSATTASLSSGQSSFRLSQEERRSTNLTRAEGRCVMETGTRSTAAMYTCPWVRVNSNENQDLAEIRKSHHQIRKDDPKCRDAARAVAAERYPGEHLDSAVPALAHRHPNPIHGSAPQDLATRTLLIGSYAMCIGIIALCVVALVRAMTAATDTTALTTSSGTLYGKRVTTSSGAKINQFLGVPYALNTAGSRRFRDPVPLGRFHLDVWKAHEIGPACTQLLNGSVHGSEDCLRLSIWAPAYDDAKQKKIVVLALTGDWFQTGNTASDGAARWAELAAGIDGVVVAPNHRLGVFGFLDVGVRGLLGNVALQDLLLAMTWIERNAEALNVDMDNMTAFGLGSGAYMLSLLLMSSTSANDTLFKRAFLQGPCPTAPLPRNSPETGRWYLARMSQDVGCYQPRIADQADCLRSVNQELLVEASLGLGQPIRFVPSAFNGETLTSLHETASFAGVEVLLGSDVSEGKRLYDYVIIPWAKDSRNSTNLRASDVFESLRTFLKGSAAGLDAASRDDAMKVVASNDMVETIVHLFTTCASKKMAAAVSE